MSVSVLKIPTYFIENDLYIISSVPLVDERSKEKKNTSYMYGCQERNAVDMKNWSIRNFVKVKYPLAGVEIFFNTSLNWRAL